MILSADNNSKRQNELETGDREHNERKVRRRKKRWRKDDSNHGQLHHWRQRQQEEKNMFDKICQFSSQETCKYRWHRYINIVIPNVLCNIHTWVKQRQQAKQVNNRCRHIVSCNKYNLCHISYWSSTYNVFHRNTDLNVILSKWKEAIRTSSLTLYIGHITILNVIKWYWPFEK